MRRVLAVCAALTLLVLIGQTGSPDGSAAPATADPACVAPAADDGSPTVSPAVVAATPLPSAGTPDMATPDPGAMVDAETAARIVTGIENFVACRNAGDYAAYAALLTPNRMLAETGSTNPADVVAGLEDFNLPITILTLGDVRAQPDGRYSAEFVHLFGPHLYYRSRLYVVEDQGIVRFDEEVFLPETLPDAASPVDVRLTDFAIALDATSIANDQYVVLHGHNTGNYQHEIVVVRLPPGATVAQALFGEIPEEDLAFVGQTVIDPGMTDDLVLVNLPAGAYTLLCFRTEPDGVPHVAKGMMNQLTIVGFATPTP